MYLGRWAVVALVAGAALVPGAGGRLSEPPAAEAARLVRAKISWAFPDDCPATLLDRVRADPDGRDRSPYRFCQSAAITRQSNPNQANQQALPDEAPIEGQVVPGAIFRDQATLTATQDVRSAVIGVAQGSFGLQRAVHVRLKLVGEPDSAARTEIDLEGTADEPAILAGVPLTLELLSQIPLESQVRLPGSRRNTPRLLTSTIRVAERSPRGSARTNLNRPLLVRTQMQHDEWTRRNGVATPTPFALSTGR